ncbi:hypothetical protein TNCV_4286451 [Trichonephila clavipes]|nr:hypothetical protein TNCV_4286451 [Trichonephila clavipes]
MSEWDYMNERVLFWMDLNGDVKWVCSTITSQNIYGSAPTVIRLVMRPSKLFLNLLLRCTLHSGKISSLGAPEALPYRGADASEMLVGRGSFERIGTEGVIRVA